MGIRVHKVLGYGLTDVKTRKYDIADGRINRKSPLLDYAADATLDQYLDWIDATYRGDKDHFSMDSWLLAERKEVKEVEAETVDFKWWREKTGVSTPRDLIHHGTEYLEKNVLVIRPLSGKDWYRSDDPIDWIEETHLREPENENGVNWYKTLGDGIFPYIGTYMNAHTGERVKEGIELRRCFTWKDWDKFYDVDKLAKDFGFVDAEDARVNLVPRVPDEVRDLAKWGKLFTNDDVWKQLRPIIYTYWS